VETLYYGYTDNQGSLVALTDVSGNVVEKYAYDPWGARRNPNDWTQNDSRTSWITNRGYTGHEHLDAFGVINMNGRVYDPLTAQFYSPDPFIQSPDNWLNYNRYSYCLNNPTMFIDPTGYQSIKQYEDGNSSPWSVFDQLAQMERRLGISNGSNGFNWYNDYIQAMSTGYNSGLSKFRTEYEKQIRNQNFNGTVTLTYNIGGYLDYTNAGVNIHGYTSPEMVTIWKSVIIVPNGAGRSYRGNGQGNDKFLHDNIGEIGFLANDFTQAFINRNTTLAIAKGYNLAKTTVFLPLGVYAQTGTKFLGVVSKTGSIVTKAAPWVSGALIVSDALSKRQINAGQIYQSVITGLSVGIPGAGLIIGGGALLGEGISYYFTGRSVAENINSSLDGGVIVEW